RLAEDFTVVVPDLRGYGDSSKPPAGADFVNYSKRALALDQVETMQALGFDKFAVAGRDHGDRIAKAALLDIVPTLYRFETIDQKAATGSFHWFFLIQPSPFPERMIAAECELFLKKMLGLSRTEGAHEAEAYAEYLRCFRDPETIRATCD